MRVGEWGGDGEELSEAYKGELGSVGRKSALIPLLMVARERQSGNQSWSQ